MFIYCQIPNITDRLPEYKGDDEAYALALQLQHLDIPEQERVEQQRLWDDSKRAAQVSPTHFIPTNVV